MNISEQFVELVKDNPNLPIRFLISDELKQGNDGWLLGDIQDCEVTSVVEYNDCVYTYDEIDEIIDDFYDTLRHQYRDRMSQEDTLTEAEEKAKWLNWQKCILVKVNV